MLYQVEHLSEKADKILKKHDEKTQAEWLDSQDVCMLLNISKRTLQTYRDTGKISFSQISHKIYYKHEDVMLLLKAHSTNPENYKDGNNNKKQ